MHDTAYRIGGLVIDTYLPSTPARILEIGAQNVNGTLRDHAPRNADYVGLDYEAGEGVSHVVTGLHDWNVPDASFDLVIASSVFEHDRAFWRTFLAMCAKAKPGGHIYISAPSNGTVHRYPQDYWRFYPDCGLALEQWASEEGFNLSLIESFVAEREAEVWNDFCAIFRRGPSENPLNRDFVYEKVAATNILTWRSPAIINPVEDSEDTRLLRAAREDVQRWIDHSQHLNAVHAQELGDHTQQMLTLSTKVEEQSRYIDELSVAAALDAETLNGVRMQAADLADEVDRLNSEAEARVLDQERQLRDHATALGQLQSRLAQRAEEAAQAWAAADDSKQERLKSAAELDKIKVALVDANKWVEKLAFIRTDLGRRINRLENTVADQSRGVERLKNRNIALEKANDLLKQGVTASASVDLQPQAIQAGGSMVETHEKNTDDLEVHRASLKDVTEKFFNERRRLKVADHELAQIRLKFDGAKHDIKDHQARLDESRREIILMTNMLISAQDRISELENQNMWLREMGRFLLQRGKWWWRFMPLSWQIRKRDRLLLKRNMFDSGAYTARYTDVAASAQDPLQHYIYHGITENRRCD